jgi:hypothetical protein
MTISNPTETEADAQELRKPEFYCSIVSICGYFNYVLAKQPDSIITRR